MPSLAWQNSVFPNDGHRQEDIHPTLTEIGATASQICEKTPLEYTDQGAALSGDAKAKLNKFLSSVADVEIGGSGEAHTHTGEKAIVEKDILVALKQGDNCRLAVFYTLEKERDRVQSNSTDNNNCYYILDRSSAFLNGSYTCSIVGGIHPFIGTLE